MAKKTQKRAKFILKWTNKYSGETGYVGKVLKTEGHFVNAEEIADAKRYSFEKTAKNEIEVLEAIGEAENNTFEVLKAE